MGKTTLVEHFLDIVHPHSSEITVVKHRCTQGTTVYEPFTNVLAALLNNKQSNNQNREKLLELIHEFAAIWLDILGTAGVAQLALKGGQIVKRLKQSKSAVPDQVIQAQYSNLLSRISSDRPIILFLDDFHCADQSTVSMVWHLSKNLAKGTFMLVCCYRDDELIRASATHEQIREFLRDLRSRGKIEIVIEQGISVLDYVNMRYPVNVFALETVKNIQLQTGGFPFYIHQLFTFWENDRSIERVATADGSYGWRFSVATELSGNVTMVPSLETLLRDQWDGLAKELRQVLSVGAVEGMQFTAQVVERVSQLNENDVFDDLDLLERQYRLIEEAKLEKALDGVVLDFYRFTHEFRQKFIYDHLNAHNRRELHRRVGACLEALYSRDHRKMIAPQLAMHFEAAHEWSLASRYALESAKLARSNYAWAEVESWCQSGLQHLERAGDAEEKRQRQFELLETSAYGLYLAGKPAESRDRFVAALGFLDDFPIEPVRLVQLYIYLADACDDIDEYEEGLGYLQLAETLLSQNGVVLNAQRLMLMAQKGLLMARTGDVRPAINLLEQAIKDSGTLESSPEVQESLVGLYNCLGIAKDYIDEYGESIELYGKAAQIAFDLNDKHMTVTCLTNQADSFRLRGQFLEAESTLSRCITLTKEIGDKSAEVYATLVHGETLLDLGHTEEAIHVLKDCLHQLQILEMRYFVVYALADLAMAYLSLSEKATAEEFALKALENAGFEHGPKAYALRALGKCNAALSRWDLATENFRAALEIYEENEDEHYALRVQCDLAETLLQVGLRRDARALLLSAKTGFDRLGLQHEVYRADRLLKLAEGT